MQISVQEMRYPEEQQKVKRRNPELCLRNQTIALEDLIKIQELNIFRYTVSLNYTKCV